MANRCQSFIAGFCAFVLATQPLLAVANAASESNQSDSENNDYRNRDRNGDRDRDLDRNRYPSTDNRRTTRTNAFSDTSTPNDTMAPFDPMTDVPLDPINDTTNTATTEPPSDANEKTIALEEPVDPEKYICGAGDQFQLNFWGHQNQSVPVIIDAQGRAFIPKVGYVKVADMTLANAITTLKGVVAKLYPRLKFDVSLVKPRTFLVHVVGAVKKPGIYKAHATDRVTKVLTAAGGQSRANRTGHGGGSTRKIEITRRGGQKLNADLLLYNRQGDTNNNPFLSDGDVIVVPFESLVITVSGAVQRPGRYELVSTKDLAELVTVAGGLNSAVTSQLPLVVSRRDPNNDTSTQLHIKLPPSKELPSLPLQNDDRVHIPGVTELQRSVMLVGAIAGAMRTDDATSILRMPYEQGDTVRSLIERAGGLDAGADYKNAFINRFDGKDKTVIPIDLEALLINRDLRADRVVHMGDVVNVPFQRRSVTVEGAVIHPGSYQYNPQLRALDYIAIAGGPGKMARDEDEYRLVTPQGKTKTVDKDTFVQPGDTVVLPERHFSRAEVTSIIISAISLAISTASLVVIATRN